VSVFVDTSALYALLVSTEDGHRETAAAFDRLVKVGRGLVTTNYVLLESAALLQRRFGLEAVRDLEDRLVPLLAVRWIDETRHRRAMDRLKRTNRRDVSLVDCASFVVMDAEGIAEALALDPDFAAQGYRVLPAG
jgi:predicted nucleic acid-binding protein